MINQAQEFLAICIETGLISIAFFAVIGVIVYIELKYHEK